MAQDIEKIIDLLNNMQKSNAANADNFERLLSSIGTKLAISDNNTNTELLRTYLGEIAKSVDDKYSNTINKFEDIERAIKAVYDSQGESVKNSDMKELFDVFSRNVNNFYTEARQEKAILAGIETKIGDLSSNKTDKEDILRTISLLRNDLGNVNLSYKNTIDDINTTLKSVLAGIKSMDPLKTGDTSRAQIDVIHKSVGELLNTLETIEKQETKLENILCNVATNEDLKITTGIIDSIQEKTREIDEKLNSTAHKDDVNEISQILDKIYRRTDDNATSEDFINLKKQTEDILSYTDEIKQTLGEIAQDIEHAPNAQDLEKSLTELYVQIDSVSKNIETSLSKNNITEISSKLNAFENELELIQNIVTDLNNALTSKVMATLKTLEDTGSELGQIVSDTFKSIPQKEDIESILEGISKKTDEISKQLENTSTSDEVAQVQYNTNEIIAVLEKLSQAYDTEQITENMTQLREQLSEIKSALDINSAVKQNDGIYEKLSDLERSVSQIVSRDEFNRFIEDLKSCLGNLTSTTSREDNFNTKEQDIEYKLSELDFSKTFDILEGKFEKLQDSIEDLNNNIISIPQVKSDTDYNFIKSELENIKSLIELHSSDFDNIEEVNNPDISVVKDYIYEIKNMLQDNPKSGLYSKLLSIEDSIVNNQTFNENAFTQILEKISNIKIGNDIPQNEEQLGQSMSEFSSLQDQIKELSQRLNKENQNIDTPEGIYFSKIENFLSEKLSQISKEMEEISLDSSQKIADNFTSQVELIEQKTSHLQQLISDIHSDKGIYSPKFDKKLADANESLGDFRQELQLISTDITENITNNSSKILEELSPIREMLDKIYKNSDPQTLRDEVKGLNDSLLSAPELADFREDFEYLYGRLTEKFTENENNLKDFILTDTDSIIIKLDNLREYIEQSLESVTPQKTVDTAELENFIEELKDFKEGQNQLLKQSVDEIKKEIKKQSDEIKSMFSVANNHEEIIEAIEKLKRSFKSKLAKTNNSNISDGEAIANGITYNEDTIEDLKSDFEKYSKKIEKLSDDNAQITSVLESISKRIEDFASLNSLSKAVKEEDLADDDFEVYEDDIFGDDKFDFVQAFDILQNDIRNLANRIDGIQYEPENKESSKIPSISGNGLVMNINSKVDEILKSLNNSWLSNIEKYITEENISLNEKLDSIESKLEVLSDSTNTDILNEVSETLGDINDSVADLTESDRKLSSMLEELNEKITKIGDDNGSIEELNNIKTLIGEQKTYIEDLEPNEKLKAFKKCLDEISFEVNALAADSNADSEKLSKTIKEMKESLMSAVVTIFDQVSFVEESEDIKDFVEERTDEINKNIAQITKQLNQMTSSDESANYTYSMQDIETDLAKLRLALQDSKQFDLSEITDKLHSITSSVDSLTQEEMKELKNEISNLKEQTEFLIANTDRSYKALNTGIDGFGKIVDDSIIGKVEHLSKMLENSAQSDKMIKQALIYMGEWIDSATTSINKISANSDEISRINEVLSGIKDLTQINNSIDEKFNFWNNQIKIIEKQFAKIENLEVQLVNQQERIDRLEMNIDKLISIVENLENPGIERKMEKIEKQLSKLGTNVEKLASYVD